MKFLFQMILSLFLLISVKSDCSDTENPVSALDCDPSNEELENSQFCCYVAFSTYSYDSDADVRKCLLFTPDDLDDLLDTYEERKSYSTYGYITQIKCNEPYDNNDELDTDCESRYPLKASDCKLSSRETNNNNVCCYISSSDGVKYCNKYTQSEYESIINNQNAETYSIVCNLNNYASFIKQPLLFLILFLFL